MKLKSQVIPVFLVGGYDRFDGQGTLTSPLSTLEHDTILTSTQLSTWDKD